MSTRQAVLMQTFTTGCQAPVEPLGIVRRLTLLHVLRQTLNVKR